MKSILVASAVVLAVVSPLAAQSTDPRDATAAAQDAGQQESEEGKPEKPGVRFVIKKHPSIRIGKALRVDLRMKLHGDLRGFSPDLETDEGLFDMNRRRVGIEGTFLKYFEYEVERELRKKNPWRDVFVNFRYVKNVQIRTGKFKIPFSLEQLTGPMNLDFVYRSRMADNLSPARDTGVTAHGRFFKRGLGYEAGVFRHDGENARVGRNPGAGRTLAGRVTARPLRLLPAPAAVKDLEVGVDGTAGNVSEGLYALRGRTASRETFFSPIYVNGRRVRFGLDVDWSPGPFSVKGEFLRVHDERRGQGLLGEDLPPLISRGWYVSSTWAVTGEPKAGGIDPQHSLFAGGFGAVELATRYERLGFGSFSDTEPPFRNPRAANLLETSDRAWTFGVNWYLNRWAKIQVNAVRERIQDTDRSPILGREVFWTSVCRLEFVL